MAAIIGIASVVVLYATMGERAKQTVTPPPQRLDPKAMIESSGNVLQQVRGTRQDYLIEAERQLTYQSGASKFVGLKITVRNRGGRDYVITGREGQAGDNQRRWLTGGAEARGQRWLVITTDIATFSGHRPHDRAGAVASEGSLPARGRACHDKNTDV